MGTEPVLSEFLQPLTVLRLSHTSLPRAEDNASHMPTPLTVNEWENAHRLAPDMRSIDAVVQLLTGVDWEVWPPRRRCQESGSHMLLLSEKLKCSHWGLQRASIQRGSQNMGGVRPLKPSSGTLHGLNAQLTQPLYTSSSMTLGDEGVSFH